MPTIYRLGNLRFVVFLNDHDPAHVHVFATGGEAKILLGSGFSRPALLWARGLDRPTLRRAMAETMKHKAMFFAAWQRLHGADERE
jgi:hypothetical protein